MGLEDLFNELEGECPTDPIKIIKAPFGYPGGKSRTVKYIVEAMPYTDRYVEPFGGSAAVLLSRRKSKFEVFNDRYAGVTMFYRCLQSPDLIDRLIKRLELTIHSREEWWECKHTWNSQELNDPVERAARWYYMMKYSFAGKGGAFGRSLDPKSLLSGKARESLKHFREIHDRFRTVQVENLDWQQCMQEYDHPDTIFYLDPPYLWSTDQTYKPMGGPSFSIQDHKRLLDFIHNDVQGYVALSGYGNDLYNQYDWDEVHEWDSFVSMSAMTKDRQEADYKRDSVKETLYIKESM